MKNTSKTIIAIALVLLGTLAIGDRAHACNDRGDANYDGSSIPDCTYDQPATSGSSLANPSTNSTAVTATPTAPTTSATPATSVNPSTSSTAGQTTNPPTSSTGGQLANPGTNSSAGGLANPSTTSTSGSSGSMLFLQNPLSPQFTSVGGIVQGALDIFSYVVVLFAVLMIIYVGLQFVLAQGKPDRLSELKGWLLWIVIGVAVVIGARIIVSVVLNTLKATNTVSQSTIDNAQNALNGH